MIHVLVVLSFGVIAWVNLIPKTYTLNVTFTVAETIAGLLIYVALLTAMRKAQRDVYREAEEQLQAIKRRRAAAYAADD